MSAGGFQQTFSQHHTRKGGFQLVRHVVVPLVMLLCSALGAFWLYSLFLLITDNTHPSNAAAAAGKDLVSYTVTTRDEYNNKIPWLRYPADHRFDPLLHTQAFEERYLTPHAEREDDDSVTIPDAKKLIDTKAYPVYFAYADLVRDWAVYDVSAEGWKRSKAHPSKKQGLARFDYRDEQQRALALRFRREELPFILTNVPEIAAAAKGEFSLERLKANFGPEPRLVEKSDNNHFMYYSVGHKDVEEVQQEWAWTPPQADVPVSFATFLRHASAAEGRGQVVDNTTALHYMTISAKEGFATSWIRDAMPFFTGERSFFIVDPAGFKGINCRFGMKGVVAAAHYDGQRNFVAMLRGRKRYILLPPEECLKLELLPPGHPSSRHSPFNWADPAALDAHPAFAAARATEVVLAMGEVLYIPSYWFHYIVSQDASIQCNARSGKGLEGLAAIDECGFSKIRKGWEESVGAKWTDKMPERPHRPQGQDGAGHLRRHGSEGAR